jgi:hypothetical protein
MDFKEYEFNRKQKEAYKIFTDEALIDTIIRNNKQISDLQGKLSEINKSLTKPLLGLVPKRVWQKERFYEVCGAIVRYYDAGKKIPIYWIEEYNELVESSNQESCG